MSFSDPTGALDFTAILALTAGIVAFLRPAIERLPFAHDSADNKDMHDLVLRAASFLINLAGILFVAYQAGELDMRQNGLMYVLLASGATVGSHLLATGIPAAKAASVKATAARQAKTAGAAGAQGKPAPSEAPSAATP